MRGPCQIRGLSCRNHAVHASPRPNAAAQRQIRRDRSLHIRPSLAEPIRPSQASEEEAQFKNRPIRAANQRPTKSDQNAAQRLIRAVHPLGFPPFPAPHPYKVRVQSPRRQQSTEIGIVHTLPPPPPRKGERGRLRRRDEGQVEEEEDEEAQEEAPKDEAAIQVGALEQGKHHPTSRLPGIEGGRHGLVIPGVFAAMAVEAVLPVFCPI
ncbi:uncharacterized protein [Triticum aestivum]|uniref:uncharacterized protein n=1 Tax=Triticum aestivum TaxID=4565 RepID=UPI001D0082C0|nr:uncharacterized protein LOC123101625 [Triticum aestivum]